MRLLYIDCGLGVTPEGLLGALSEIIVSPAEDFTTSLNTLAPNASLGDAGNASKLPRGSEDLDDLSASLNTLAPNASLGDPGFDALTALLKKIAPERVIASPVGIDGVSDLPRGLVARGRAGARTNAQGAALIAKIADEYGEMPEMKLLRTGESDGVRAYLGDAVSEISMLNCNIDDMTAEALSFACETLAQMGARDVFTIPVGMKKSRQGVLLVCVCDTSRAAELSQAILKHTSTLGVREIRCISRALERRTREIMTEYGALRVKEAFGDGIYKAKPEYDDVAQLARANATTFEEITRAARKMFDGEGGTAARE